jgi:hypothetical protein
MPPPQPVVIATRRTSIRIVVARIGFRILLESMILHERDRRLSYPNTAIFSERI